MIKKWLIAKKFLSISSDIVQFWIKLLEEQCRLGCIDSTSNAYFNYLYLFYLLIVTKRSYLCLAVFGMSRNKLFTISETICKYVFANFTGVDFWTSPYTNGTVDFMISPKEYTRVVRHLQHEKIPFKVNKKCVKSLLKECYLDIHMLKG